MKKILFILSIVSFVFLSYSQEPTITIPQLTTYIPSSVEQKLVITSEEIEAAHNEDLSSLVESRGIQMLSYGPYGLESKASLRGFTDETVRVVIDGICVNNAQYGTFDLSSINLDAIERIEIIRGAFTEGVEDEGSVAGVIYITMKKQELKNSLKADTALKTFFNSEMPLDSVFQKLAFEGQLSENTFLTANGTLNYAGNHYLYKQDKSYSLLDGPFGAAVTQGRDGAFYQGKEGFWKSAENSQVTDGHANAFLTHYFGDGNYISFGDIFYAGHKNTPGPVNSANSGLQRDYNNNLSFSLWNPALADGLFNLKNSIAWLCNNRFYQDNSEKSSHYINTIKYSSTAEFTSLAGGRLYQTTGLSADYTYLDSTNDGFHHQFSAVLKETSRFSLTPGWSVSLPLAVKLCMNDTLANFAFVPKLGAAWQSPSGLWTLSSDLYRMVLFPNMDDLFWEGSGFHGNPNLKPENGWGADFGLKLKNIKKGPHLFTATFTLFSNYYKDKIRWASNTTENLSSAFYLGLDFSAEAKLFSGFLILNLNGEYLYNRLLDKDNEYTYGKRIMWTPDFVCTLSGILNFEVASLSLNITYTGRRYTDNMNLYFLNPYLLVNLLVEGASIKNRFVPYLKIDNLLNWQYQSVEAYPMPGASLTVGARYNFF